MLRLAFRAARSGWAELKLLPLKAAVADHSLYSELLFKALPIQV